MPTAGLIPNESVSSTHRFDTAARVTPWRLAMSAMLSPEYCMPDKVRIHGSMRPQIKYIAVYQVAPVSAITHVAPVKSIEPWKSGTKYVINFAHAAKSIGPIKLVKKGRVKALQNLRYTSLSRLENAKNLDDVW